MGRIPRLNTVRVMSAVQWVVFGRLWVSLTGDRPFFANFKFRYFQRISGFAHRCRCL